MNARLNELKISDDKSLLNIDTIYVFMQRSYWANRRPKDKIKKSIENSLCYGVYDGGKQVGFARIVTDWATMYYLCDVYIDEDYRVQGIGKKLIEEIVSSECLRNLFGYLGTKDAHSLYEQYDFIREQEKVMTRMPDFLRNK
ncbi:GNAT family N-acetyltransferase [Salipaludibacillus neizhouensis]|uniref:GNAT family N-acetyltransferase n=1 Tax=Salipaludibacillus neizhouensis TaxID=885475 RepID=A0A3A9KBP5_9BACI|nr:GNAT family N-acetyltransferase [Salipaludibacillus neizhouensis]RKL64755.1 GNAT family N-acetyltransferase [Salipaludibacillus neizhouensis]